MKLVKRLLTLAFIVFVITMFMYNKDLKIAVGYFGLSAPIDIPFWIIVTVSFCCGFLILAVVDSVSQIKWMREKSSWVKIDKERTDQIDKVNLALRLSEDFNRQLKADLEQKKSEVEELKKQQTVTEFNRMESLPKEAPSTSGPGTNT